MMGYDVKEISDRWFVGGSFVVEQIQAACPACFLVPFNGALYGSLRKIT
jgi:hypothetical protein